MERLGGYRLAERGVVVMKGKGDQLTYWLKGEDEDRREIRAKERTERRAFNGNDKNKQKQSQSKQSQQPRSSLKSKHHSECSARRNPLSRCSSLESPKKLRFASIDHRISKDPLLEVISDNSPKKSCLLEVGTTDHVRRTSSSCPCIEKFESGHSAGTDSVRFLDVKDCVNVNNNNNNNSYTSSSVPLLNRNDSDGFDRPNNINIYIDPEEISVNAPLLN